MRSRALALFAILGMLFTSAAGAGTFVSLTAGADESAEAVDVQVVNQSLQAITLDYRLAGFELEEVTIGGATYHTVTLGEESNLLEAGFPELPTINRSVIIPDDMEMQIRVIRSSYQEFSGIDVVPSKGSLTRDMDPASVPYTFGDLYEQAGFFPSELAEIGEPYILRDYRGAVVTINPVQYDPSTHTLRVYDYVEIELVPVGPGAVNVIQRADGVPADVHPEFDKLYTNHFINYAMGGFGRYAPIDEVGEMIVIAYDSYASAVEPLVEWKNQMGVPTTLLLLSEVGSSANQIKSYVQNYYDTHDLAFVLLVGDLPQIPSLSNAGAPADPMYALVAGSDNYPDIFIGRISAQDLGAVALQVTKFVEYESLPQAAGWYQKGVGIASAEGAGIGDDGEADWVHIDYIRDDLLGFTYDEVDQLYAIYGASASDVAAAVNAGRSIINYCGHGSSTSWSTTGFNNNHVNALTNDNKLPVIVSVACVNGAFQYGSTCFAEAWMQASHSGEPTGAVGIYASTVNMQWAPPMSAQDETADLLVAEAKYTWGALCFSGSCLMIDEYGYNGISEFKNWTIFGDPSLRVRTATPMDLTVEYEDTIDPDATTYGLTVPGVEGALCGLSKDGIYLGSAFTNASGYAEIPVVGTLPEETVTLTVTHFNRNVFAVELSVGEPLVPALFAEPGELTFYVPLGEQQSDFLTISNVGMEGSVLEARLSMSPPLLNPWMSFDPSYLEVPYGESVEVQVTVDTEGLAFGTHAANIAVQSNGGRAMVPVTLITADYSDVNDRTGLPSRLQLAPATPNPLHNASTITFGLPQTGAAHLGVYDMSGRLVRTLVSGQVDAGYHTLTWDGRDEAGQPTSGGVYFYRLDASSESLSGKVMVLR